MLYVTQWHAISPHFTPVHPAFAALPIQVSGKRWRVDLMSRQEAALALSAVHLPGGAQRRRNAEDELKMREVLKEADLVSVSACVKGILM
jgi:hypothetical protein